MSGIKIQPRFVLFVKWAWLAVIAVCFLILAGTVVVRLLQKLWQVWDTAAVLNALEFGFLSMFRSFVNGAFVLTGGILLVWLIWSAAARWVFDGLRRPKFPAKTLIASLVAALVLGAVLLPVDWRYNNAAKTALAPLAEQFTEKSGCDNSSCWADDNILVARDRLLATMNASRVHGWSVRNPLGEGTVYNTRALYFWRNPFFPLLSNW